MAETKKEREAREAAKRRRARSKEADTRVTAVPPRDPMLALRGAERLYRTDDPDPYFTHGKWNESPGAQRLRERMRFLEGGAPVSLPPKPITPANDLQEIREMLGLTGRSLTPEERRTIAARPQVPPNALHQDEVAAWLKAKRDAVQQWITTHTPDLSSADLAMARRTEGRYPGEVPMTPIRETAHSAVETLAPRTMGDLMLLGYGAARHVFPESEFVRVPERSKAQVYERARSLDPESPLWSNPVPPKLDVYQAKSGADDYYGLGPGYANPSVKEIEMVSRRTSPAAMRDAVRRGGETSLLFDVPTSENLPNTLRPHGFEPAWEEPYNMEFGAPDEALQGAWQTEGWQPGDPLPGVKFMMRPTTRVAPRVIPRYEPPR